MAEVKDKVVTVGSLNVLHDYNKETYMEKTADGLNGVLAEGTTVLSDYQYGDELPEAGTEGRIFFKRLINIISFTIDSLGTLEAEEGMTWEEWCNSKYNTIGLYTDTNNYSYVFKDTDGTKYYLAAVMAAFDNTVEVSPREFIDFSTEYVLVEYSE